MRATKGAEAVKAEVKGIIANGATVALPPGTVQVAAVQSAGPQTLPRNNGEVNRLNHNRLDATALRSAVASVRTIRRAAPLLVVTIPTAAPHQPARASLRLMSGTSPKMRPWQTGRLMAGQFARTLFVACAAMFGLSLLVGMLTITMVYSRLLHAGLPALQAVPTVWITLGVVGQSITAANLLGAKAAAVFGDQPPLVNGWHVFGVMYGCVAAGVAAFVFSLATALTVHALRRGLTFTLTRWSFTFPVGTCVTGASALGIAANSGSVKCLAVALFVVLVLAWATVAAHTIRGSWSGRLFLQAR